VAGDLGKARTVQEEGTQTHQQSLQQKVNIFTNSLFREGETLCFPSEKNPKIKPLQNLIL